ncbi:MAG: hypothetical protein HY360_22020 [Verrucomicrobia bacterium]|nr:hypothetical protein [Verrucomicrobiota bacterium]
MASGITHLIINSPFAEPKRHWLYERKAQKFSLMEGRRLAGYVIASESSKSFDDPDHLIRLVNGTMLIVETKGQDTEKDRTKRRYLNEWVNAVNTHGGFGNWKSGVCLNPADLPTVIQEATKT